ncbi:MAG: DNA-processing protein DprA, partial [Chloroflexi bacterium]|nr:DNA-processing protein DprA [Chloroflexota bacterium]
VPGIGPKIAASIRSVDGASVEKRLTVWRREGVRLVDWRSPAYPAPLHALDDAPALLFVRGSSIPCEHTASTVDLSHCLGVAIVGTRSPTPGSRAAAYHMARALARNGNLIISGLALGVDGAAHRGALAADGPTVAVLGGGVLRIYPHEHRMLADHMRVRGGLISEVAPDDNPRPTMLVARNRIISGLSRALVVIETAVDGGAMHAARRAHEQGRPVYVLDTPAPGNRALISEIGAQPITPDEMSPLLP